jgi:hypothetical protein
MENQSEHRIYKWVENKEWLIEKTGEMKEAENMRVYLAAFNMVPSTRLGGIPVFEKQGSRLRIALHDMIDRLCLEDLQAAYQIIHLLVISQRLVENIVNFVREISDRDLKEIRNQTSEKSIA